MALLTERRRPVQVDWRLAADPDDLREYDAFGPWIDKVQTEIGMPRAFRAYYPELRDSAFLLKIPRDIDRAAARPGQDLYRAVLAVHDQGVCVLSLAGGAVTRADTTWQQVVACGTYSNLLLARWTLLLADGSDISVNLNSVGLDMMAKVTGYVRAHITAATGPGTQPDLPAMPVPQDYFASKLAILKRTMAGPVVPIHVEQKNRLCRVGRLRPRLSTGVMIVDTPQELVLVTGGEPTRSLFAANYATNSLVVPHARLDSYAVLPAAVADRQPFRRLLLRAGDQVIQQHCLDDPGAAVTTLAARGIPEAVPAGSLVFRSAD